MSTTEISYPPQLENLVLSPNTSLNSLFKKEDDIIQGGFLKGNRIDNAFKNSTPQDLLNLVGASYSAQDLQNITINKLKPLLEARKLQTKDIVLVTNIFRHGKHEVLLRFLTYLVFFTGCNDSTYENVWELVKIIEEEVGREFDDKGYRKYELINEEQALYHLYRLKRLDVLNHTKLSPGGKYFAGIPRKDINFHTFERFIGELDLKLIDDPNLMLNSTELYNMIVIKPVKPVKPIISEITNKRAPPASESVRRTKKNKTSSEDDDDEDDDDEDFVPDVDMVQSRVTKLNSVEILSDSKSEAPEASEEMNHIVKREEHVEAFNKLFARISTPKSIPKKHKDVILKAYESNRHLAHVTAHLARESEKFIDEKKFDIITKLQDRFTQLADALSDGMVKTMKEYNIDYKPEFRTSRSDSIIMMPMDTADSILADHSNVSFNIDEDLKTQVVKAKSLALMLNESELYKTIETIETSKKRATIKQNELTVSVMNVITKFRESCEPRCNFCSEKANNWKNSGRNIAKQH